MTNYHIFSCEIRALNGHQRSLDCCDALQVVGGPQRIKCPFLDTINRKRLDFDLAKECSVTLVKKNIYCCLVCGKYFSGRGKRTHAYTHSVEKSHHVFVNLETGKFYCLPG